MHDRLIGFDINGWHDFAVRNWRLDQDRQEDEVPEGQLIDGGALSRTVWVGDEEDGDEKLTPVGGPRAQLAMHGRGPGWGEFGNERRRKLIRRTTDPVARGACMKELGSQPKIAVLAIPDLPTTDEAARESWLAAMRSLRARRSMLIWSSVALALHQCQLGRVEDGCRLGVIELEADGLRIQCLDIIAREGLLTPRRRKVGRLVPSGVGLARREQTALEEITALSDNPRLGRVLELADLPGLLAMAGPSEMKLEMLRLENGDWVEAEGKAPSLSLGVEFAEFLKDVDQVVLHGPCEERLLHAVSQHFRAKFDTSIEVLEPSAAARGAFLAAARLQKGHPPWFDYLPNVETIVQVGDRVESLSLVDPEDVAEAGKVWRSRHPVSLIWSGLSDRKEIWLRKEDEPDPRYSPATVTEAPGKDQDVQLILEQEPAQGRAKLRITSDTWSLLRDRPAVVDWDAGALDPDARSWEEIIEDLAVRPPVVPERVVLPAHRELWYLPGGEGLAAAIWDFDDRDRDYEGIYRALSARRQVYWDQPEHPAHERRFYAVDSDGGRPEGVRDEDWTRLLQVIELAEADFTSGRVANNHALGVLSWCFRLCPGTIWPIVARILKNDGGGQASRGWQTMYPQALGRIVHEDDAIQSAIGYLGSLESPWNKNQQACVAFLLSRNDRVFELADRSEVEQWTRAAVASLKEVVKGGFTPRHQYLPVFLAGLLRWRLREPNAFSPGRDPKAELLSDLLENTIRRRDTPEKQLEAFKTVRAAIADTGARPDILQTLFDLL